MPRVLWLCELAALNGAERSLLACLNGVRAAGFDIVAAAPPRGPLATALAEFDVPLLPLVCDDAQGRRLPPDRLSQRLGEIFAGVQPNLVHANSLTMGRLCATAVQNAHLPSIGHLRDIVGLSKAGVEQLNRHSRLLAVSATTREFHVRQGIAAEHCQVLYNGVDCRQFQPQPKSGCLHRELGIALSARFIGNIGQIGPRKGQDLLLAAFAEVAPQFSDAHLLLIGERHGRKLETVEFEAALHHRVLQLGLTDRVHFLGSRADVPRLLPELTMLVHAARQEPLGRVLLEAGACGCPIIATGVGGTREIFPEETGAAILIKTSEPPSLAQAMRTLLGDPSLADAIGQAARRRIVERFTIERAVAGLSTHYREVLAAHPAKN